MRSVFSLLNRQRSGRVLYLSPDLVSRKVCLDARVGKVGEADCPAGKTELFIPGTTTQRASAVAPRLTELRIRQPTPGLQLAVDPRVPLTKQAFSFQLQGADDADRVSWVVDGRLQGEGWGGQWLWQLQRGAHRLQAEVRRSGMPDRQILEVDFIVK